jgi:hypothetical protein
MEENIKLNKEVFAKRPYKKIIDTSFTELGVKSIQEQLDSQPTVQEFFNLYNELFYQINELGPTNSHEYLVKTSGQYIAFEVDNDLIEALQLEIADLRKELLGSQQELANALLPEPAPIDELPSVNIENPEPPANIIAEVINTPAPEAPPPPKASEKDQEMYDAGYQYQEITWEMMSRNLKFIEDNPDAIARMPEKLGKESRDLDDIKKKNISKKAIYMDWKAAIKKRSSGKETKNLYKILATTVNILRKEFVKNKSFGNGVITNANQI